MEACRYCRGVPVTRLTARGYEDDTGDGGTKKACELGTKLFSTRSNARPAESCFWAVLYYIPGRCFLGRANATMFLFCLYQLRFYRDP